MTSPTSASQLDEDLLVLFDGHALFHRAFHAINTNLSVSHTGEQVAAVYGFAASILRTVGQLKPAHAAVAFDLPTPTFRHRSFSEYKAHRPTMPDVMRDQFGRIREVVEKLGLPIFELEGFEADDVLGCLAQRATEHQLRTIIVTGDTDTMQLVSPTVSVMLQRGARVESLFDVEAVHERYGLGPEQIADLKGIQGDPSDNIPGVAGIGTKTATTLLQQFGTVDGIYTNLEDVTPERVRELLRVGEGQARMGLDLTTIVTGLPIDPDPADLQWTKRFDRRVLVDFFRELEFTSLIGRLPPFLEAPVEGGGAPAPAAMHEGSPDAAVEVTLVASKAQLETVLAEAAKAPAVGIFTPVPSGTNLADAEPVGVALSWERNRAVYIPLHHQAEFMSMDNQSDDAGETEGSLTPEEALALLGPFFVSNGRDTIVHIAREALTPIVNSGSTLGGQLWDTSVAAHLLGKPTPALAPLVLSELGEEFPTLAQLLGTGRKAVPFESLPRMGAASYSGRAAGHLLHLYERFAPELEAQHQTELFTAVEMALAPALARIERNGILVDVGFLREMGQKLHTQIDEIERDIYDRVIKAGGPAEFNVNSPKQLGEILFEKLGLRHGRKTQTGYSTDASVLEMIKDEDQSGVVVRVIEYRELSKLVSTYLDSLPSLVNQRTSRIHTTFHQTGSATGRVSSSDPNLQNIPIRTETGKRIRSGFIAPEGAELVGADYSQIELRVLAHLSDDPGLREAFALGEDIHASTASRVMGIEPGEVATEHRRIAKAVNFGIVYGMSGFGLAARLDIPREEADRFIAGYFERYPKVQQYMRDTIEQARELGYVQTLLGRRRYLPEIHAGNSNIRASAERMAINMPVQGTAAEVIKLAMLRVQERLDDLGSNVKMLLQIHDELVFECPLSERGALDSMLLEVMPRVMPELDVPLAVELKSGVRWGEFE